MSSKCYYIVCFTLGLAVSPAPLECKMNNSKYRCLHLRTVVQELRAVGDMEGSATAVLALCTSRHDLQMQHTATDPLPGKSSPR